MAIVINEEALKKISESIMALNQGYAEFLQSIEVERWVSKDEAMAIGSCTARQLDYAAQTGRIKYMDISKRKRKYWLSDIQEYFKTQRRSAGEKNNPFATGSYDSSDRSGNRDDDMRIL